MATHSSVLAWRIPGTEGLVGCHLWGRTESDTTEATQQQQQQQQQHSTVLGYVPHLLYPFIYQWTFRLLPCSHWLPWWLSGKESTCQCRIRGFDPWVGEDPLEKETATRSSIPA